ncbi:MAG: hypothetical protein M0Z96_01675 [Actinomycetota bacterium]|nr:hypothetical protein [Actinomycetota bacterium]
MLVPPIGSLRRLKLDVEDPLLLPIKRLPTGWAGQELAEPDLSRLQRSLPCKMGHPWSLTNDRRLQLFLHQGRRVGIGFLLCFGLRVMAGS